METDSRFNRRRILTTAVGLGAAAGVATSIGFAGAENATGTTDVGAAGSAPASGMFSLKSGSDRLFWKKRLHDETVLQCFAFDNKNGRLYTMQRSNGASATSGDLTVTRLDLNGKETGRMFLKGFGHGIAFGVQPTSNGITMWTEADAQSSGGASARAKSVCRFTFKSNSTITKKNVEIFRPISGMYSASCSVDIEHNTIAVRHQVPDSGMRVALYDLTEFAAGNFKNKLASIASKGVSGITAQGYQHYGQYLYLIQGNAYHHPNADKYCSVEHPNGELAGNTYLTRIDFNDSSRRGSRLTKAGYSLSFREPEGLGLVNIKGKPRLAMGFASGCGGDRRASIYYKRDAAT